jgi:hypothetical protein
LTEFWVIGRGNFAASIAYPLDRHFLAAMMLSIRLLAPFEADG